MALRVTIQVRFRPSHFLQTLLDDLVGTLRIRLVPLTSQFMWLAPANSTRNGLGITVSSTISSSPKQSKTNQADKDCQLLEPTPLRPLYLYLYGVLEHWHRSLAPWHDLLSTGTGSLCHGIEGLCHGTECVSKCWDDARNCGNGTRNA